MIEILHSPRDVYVALPAVYAMLFGAGTYIASTAIFYRILNASSGTRQRCNELAYLADVRVAIERRPAKLDLIVYPYSPRATVRSGIRMYANVSMSTSEPPH